MKAYRTSLAAIFVHTISSYAVANDTDQFNYRETDTSGANNDYGPKDWGKVTCSDVLTCAGWPDAYPLSKEWTIDMNGNSCEFCPVGSTNCGTHHQSPIELNRDRGILGNKNANECVDLHWMKHEGGSCTFDELVEKNAFTIERHALKIKQPLEYGGVIRLDCSSPTGRLFPRIDFSRGFSAWWFLSHIDFKVPSEHTQDGKRYSAEVQMAHFYSLGASEAGVNNEMAHVSIFLEAYDDAMPYLFLDRLICQWRRAEEKQREICGLPSVQNYPGCFPYSRGRTDFPVDPPSTSPSPTATANPSLSPVTPTVSPSKAPVVPAVLQPVIPEPEPPVKPFTLPPVVTLAPNPSASPVVTPAPNPTESPSLPPVNPTSITPQVSASSDPAFSPSLVPSQAASVVATPGETNSSLAPVVTPVTQMSVVPSMIVTMEATPVLSPSAAPVTLASVLPSMVLTPVVVSTVAPVTSVTLVPSAIASVAATPVKNGSTSARNSSIPTNPGSTTARRLRNGSVHDVIRNNYNREGKKATMIEIDSINYRDADWTDQEWEEWIKSLYSEDKDLETVQNDERKLLEGEFLSFDTYQFLIDVRTEYYYRYSGTQTVPPCYGPFTSGTRGNTNHWRVMKDPIRVHPRQIAEMERLLKDRIAPTSDPFRACKPDTAGVIDELGHISVARPLQNFHIAHYESFCECKDWPSKWPEDREWCKIENIEERFYSHPYNFKTIGF